MYLDGKAGDIKCEMSYADRHGRACYFRTHLAKIQMRHRSKSAHVYNLLIMLTRIVDHNSFQFGTLKA